MNFYLDLIQQSMARQKLKAKPIKNIKIEKIKQKINWCTDPRFKRISAEIILKKWKI